MTNRLKAPGNDDGHYGSSIQPVEYIEAQKLTFDEGSAVKYISRHRKKGGAEDLKKAIWYLKRELACSYGEPVEDIGQDEGVHSTSIMIRNARRIMRELFEKDAHFKQAYIANVGMFLRDRGYLRRPMKDRNAAAEGVIDLIFAEGDDP